MRHLPQSMEGVLSFVEVLSYFVSERGSIEPVYLRCNLFPECCHHSFTSFQEREISGFNLPPITMTAHSGLAREYELESLGFQEKREKRWA